MSKVLRLNQGDPSEARIYYCAHFVAAGLGLFEKEGVEIAFTSTQSGGHTVRGGQIPAVLSGEADLTVGGPMVTMKNYEEQGPALVSFSACVRANPWFFAAASARPDFSLADLKGKRIIDIGNVGTATLALQWLLRREGLADAVILPGSGDEGRDIAAVVGGEADFAYHSLHALSPYAARGQVAPVASLAGPMGGLPWSAYIARPERIAEDRPLFAGFVRAIEQALAFIATAPAEEIVGLVRAYYPDMDDRTLIVALEGYRTAKVFAPTAFIDRADFDRFASLLKDIGWLRSPVPYDDLIDMTLCSQLGQREFA